MLRRRSIRLRIIILVLVPVLALVGLYAVVLDLTMSTYLTLRAGNNVQKEITQPVSNLQVQLSTERAIAMLYLAEPRQRLLDAFLYQERHTDLSVRAFTAAATSSAVTGGGNTAELRAIGTWRADLATLNALRTSVASNGISRTDALTAYSSIITDGNNVTNQAILPLITGSVGIQAIDITTLEKSAQIVAEESDLIRADLTARTVPAADLQLFAQLVALHQEIWNETLPALDPSYQVYFRTLIPQAASSGLAALENDILLNGVPQDRKATLRAWTSTMHGYGAGLQAALFESGVAIENSARAQEQGFALRLILTGGLGLLAIVAAIVVALVMSRGMVRQLNELRLSALEVSGQRLPSAIERLRVGEELDLAIEAPALATSTNEIGQVRQAFNTVYQAAIAAAVDESRIRSGVNDVFRNLARRNQSLLIRQLQLLDAMERRIHDPEELADLFRIDHLTTRMRRHAEGLLIVAGGSSGRSWREPVPIVDVMRAAVAEVEDYTRIRVMSRTSAAVAGHAVADVIHLLAELLENATMFSPTNTPVRVDSDMVARGLAVEIEDRGLGMSEEQIAEINHKLADPPLFDLSGSDQLGLFIAGQLATRHDIRITLRTSAFGGTAAVILLPRSLIVVTEEDDPLAVAGVRELGGRPIPQLLAALPRTDGGNGAQGSSAADSGLGHQRMPDPSAYRGDAGLGDSPLTAPAASGWSTIDTDEPAPFRATGAGGWPARGADEPATLTAAGSAWPATADESESVTTADVAWPQAVTDEPAPLATLGTSPWPATADDEPTPLATIGTSPWPSPGTGEQAPLIGTGDSAWPAAAAEPAPLATAGDGAWPSPGTGEPAPLATAGTAPRPASAAGEQAPLIGTGDGAWPAAAADEQAPPATAGTTPWPASAADDPAPAATAGTSQWPAPGADTSAWASRDPGTSVWPARDAGTSAWSALGGDSGADQAASAFTSAPMLPRRPSATMAATGVGDRAKQAVSGFSADQADPADLPVRVRQASLAPQLRGQSPAARSEREDSAAGPSPEAARSTMAALQQGWERGRSLQQPIADTMQPGTDAPSADDSQDADGQPEGGIK